MEESSSNIIIEKQCRICLENDNPEDLINPCKCKGTSKYVHKECLNQWRTLSNNTEAYNKCFECGYTYKMKPHPKKNACNESMSSLCRLLSGNLCLFFMFNFFIIYIITELFELFDTERIIPKTLNFDNYLPNQNYVFNCYFIISAVCYVFMLFIVGIITFINIKKKRLYIFYFCRNRANIMLPILFVGFILFSINYSLTIFLISILFQIILKQHFMFIDAVRQENLSDIENYDENLLENNTVDNEYIGIGLNNTGIENSDIPDLELREISQLDTETEQLL